MTGPSPLRATSEEHHALIEPHVDRLLALAGSVGEGGRPALLAAIAAEHAFLVGQLVPHMETVETALYGEMDALLAGRHSLDPMREEHRIIRQLVDELGQLAGAATGDRGADAGDDLALRRVLYRLHALLKVHLAEEALYLGVLEANLTDAEKDQLARSLDHATAESL